MKILLTGGLGYIGSHTAVVLSSQGHEIVLLDNLSNSDANVLDGLKVITGESMVFYQGDVRDRELLGTIFNKHSIEVVIHFAGLKSVAESASDPLSYYDNNVSGSIVLIGAMKAAKIYKLIFSSSATVYGIPQYLPYDEKHPLDPINVYGKTKLQVEKILSDIALSDPAWSIAALRYFNPVGAHVSGLIGESPRGRPNNLMPYICQVASGKYSHLNVFGDDYDTKDGTGERDYIHVMDIAEGHAAALELVNERQGFEVINLGTGVAHSVFELIDAFERASRQTIKKLIQERRAGDLPIYYAKAEKAKNLLHWEAKRGLQEMCESSWKFQKTLQN